jgi:hypothetical protein
MLEKARKGNFRIIGPNCDNRDDPPHQLQQRSQLRQRN